MLKTFQYEIYNYIFQSIVQKISSIISFENLISFISYQHGKSTFIALDFLKHANTKHFFLIFGSSPTLLSLMSYRTFFFRDMLFEWLHCTFCCCWRLTMHGEISDNTHARKNDVVPSWDFMEYLFWNNEMNIHYIFTRSWNTSWFEISNISIMMEYLIWF